MALANLLPGSALRDAFAALMVLVAAQLVRRALFETGPPPGASAPAPVGASDHDRSLAGRMT